MRSLLTSFSVRKASFKHVLEDLSALKTKSKSVYSHLTLNRWCSAMTDKVHVTAQDGFKQGSFYDQSRPSYTDELLTHVFQNLYRGPKEGVKYHILELGAGTGKFTKKILEKLNKDLPYLATEPSEDFLSVLKDKVPGVDTAGCAATNIPLPDSSVQNIVCAQCFHWFATEESLQEMTRVLVPDGRVILVWNNKDWNIDWIKEMEDVLTRYYDDTPRAVTRQWKTVMEGFKPLATVEHKFLAGVSNMRGNKDFIVDHFSSISVIARLEASEKEKARAAFHTILDKYFPADQDIHIPFESEYYCAKKS